MELSLNVKVHIEDLAQTLSNNDAATLIQEINWAQGSGDFTYDMAAFFIWRVLECEQSGGEGYSDKLRELLNRDLK